MAIRDVYAGADLLGDFAAVSSSPHSSASAAYTTWAAEIGVSSTQTLSAIDGDDATYMLDVGFGVTKGATYQSVAFSSESGLGVYRAAPTNTTSVTLTSLSAGSASVGRATVTTHRPPALITVREPTGDLRSEFGKWQKSGQTAIIFARHRTYNDPNTRVVEVAYKITPGGVEVVATNINATSPKIQLFEFDTNSASAENGVVINSGFTGTVHYSAGAVTGARKKSVVLAGASGAGADYQVLLKVGESRGASGYDLYLGTATQTFPSAKNDIGDLRFKTQGGADVPAWVEQVTGVAPNRVAWIWLKVPLDLGTNQSIYCQYNNGPGVPASNGNNVFELFDDFDGTSLDAAKWEYKNGSGGLTISGGEAVITGNATFRQIGSVNTQPDGREVVGRVYPPTTTLSYVGDFGFREYGSGDNCMFRNDWDTQGTSQFLRNNSTITELDARYQSAYYRLRVRRSGGAASVLINDVQKASGASGAPTAAKNIPLLHVYDSGSTSKVDWIAVKKYQVTEPAYSSAGTEEAVSTANVATGFQTGVFGTPRRVWVAAGFLTGASGIHSSPRPAIGFQAGAFGSPTHRRTQPATSVAPATAFGTPGVYYTAAGFKVTEFGVPTIPVRAEAIAQATAFGTGEGMNVQRPAAIAPATQFGLAAVKPIAVGFAPTKFGISSIPLIARTIPPNTSFGVAKGKSVLQVAGIYSSQIGTPRATATARAAGFRPTTFGTPIVNTHIVPRTGQAASLGVLAKIPQAYHAFKQTPGASGWVATKPGTPVGIRYTAPNLGKLVQAFGFRGTALGTHSAKWRQTGQAPGFLSFALGTPLASKQQRATGFAGPSLGTPKAVWRLRASGFANTVLNTPLLRMRQPASTAQSASRFGLPTAKRPGSHQVYGFTRTGRFGQPRAALRINRIAAGFTSTVLGAPASTLRYRAQHLAPTIIFSTPLLRRTPLC